MDGLYFESDTHEWFKDITTTKYAQMKDKNGVGLANIRCFILRNKDTGDYDRVIMDAKTNAILFRSKQIETIGARIDILKNSKHFVT